MVPMNPSCLPIINQRCEAFVGAAPHLFRPTYTEANVAHVQGEKAFHLLCLCLQYARDSLQIVNYTDGPPAAEQRFYG
jgi:hypothetical protein